MADNAHPAVRTGRRERMDRALEAVKGIGLAGRDDLKGFVVVVPARVAFGHRHLGGYAQVRPDGVGRGSLPPSATAKVRLKDPTSKM